MKDFVLDVEKAMGTCHFLGKVKDKNAYARSGSNSVKLDAIEAIVVNVLSMKQTEQFSVELPPDIKLDGLEMMDVISFENLILNSRATVSGTFGSVVHSFKADGMKFLRKYNPAAAANVANTPTKESK